jgi:hypothetical protein
LFREVVKDALSLRYKKLKEVAASPDKHLERMKEKIDKRRDKVKQVLKNKKKVHLDSTLSLKI